MSVICICRPSNGTICLSQTRRFLSQSHGIPFGYHLKATYKEHEFKDYERPSPRGQTVWLDLTPEIEKGQSENASGQRLSGNFEKEQKVEQLFSSETEGNCGDIKTQSMSRGRNGRTTEKRTEEVKAWRKWSPYTLKGRDDLKLLLSSLQEMARKIARQEQDVEYFPIPFEGSRILSRKLPRSPIERRLQVERVRKPLPQRTVKQPLEYNPWAQMLASPLRMCSATGVRMPRDLLSPWTLTRNPVDHHLYLLPSQLANLERLRQGVKEKTVMGKTHEAEVDENVAHLEGDGDDSAPSTRTEEERQQDISIIRHLPKLYILPMSEVLEHLTLTLTNMGHGAYKDIRLQRGQVIRLLPFRLRTALQEANRHAKAEKGQEPESEDKDNFHDSMNLRDLKWQADIQERMLHILQERVIAAFEGFFRQNSSVRKRKMIKVFRSDRLDQLNTTIESEGNSDVASLNGGADQSFTESQEESLAQRLSGSILLELGSEPSPAPTTMPDTNTNMSPQAAKDPSTMPSLPDNNLFPRMIPSSNRTSCPIFSIHHLLGEAGQKRFVNLVKEYDIFDRSNTDSTINIEANDWLNGVAILIPARNPVADTLIKEVWRLWRYVGGESAHEKGEDFRQ